MWHYFVLFLFMAFLRLALLYAIAADCSRDLPELTSSAILAEITSLELPALSGITSSYVNSALRRFASLALETETSRP
jgi:hypothetical protein